MLSGVESYLSIHLFGLGDPALFDYILTGNHFLMKPKALLSWSSGKDSAWSLHVVRSKQEVEVVGLLTTVNTFAYDGPMFRHPVPVQLGEIVERDGFVFADLLPSS